MKYANVIKKQLPNKVSINSISEVSNYFNDENIIPLFSVDVILKEDKFAYAIAPNVFVKSCLQVFDKGINILNNISSIERKILKNIHLTNNDILKSPIRPLEEPHKPTAYEISKGMLPDIDAWI